MSSLRKITLSMGIVIFIAACFSQWIFGKREDWPFSYFGMFKGRLYPDEIGRVVFQAKDKSGQSFALFSLGPYSYFYIAERIEDLVIGRVINNKNEVVKAGSMDIKLSEETKDQVSSLIQQDLKDYLQRYDRTHKVQEVLIKYQTWKDFTPSKRSLPDQELIILRGRVGENYSIYKVEEK